MKEKLMRITSSYFCAGVILNSKEIIIETAPILKWSKGRDLWWFEKYCKKKKWGMEIITSTT